MTDPRYIRLRDPDSFIYRSERLANFRKTLAGSALYLASPSAWRDPLEDPLSYVPPDVRGFTLLYRAAFAQCWSAQNGADVSWRSYSTAPRHSRQADGDGDEGVQIRSTLRKLLAALSTWTTLDPADSCFIGAVEYLARDELDARIRTLLAGLGVDLASRASLRAESLLIKRREFWREAEVRLIYVSDGSQGGIRGVTVPIEVNALIDEVAFDPRLSRDTIKERIQECRGRGYMGSVSTRGQ